MGKSAILFFICWLSFYSIAEAQQDSLKSLLNTNLSAKEHLAVLEQLIEANRYEDRPQSLVYGQQAFQYASQNEDIGVRTKARELLGYAYYINFEFDSALLYLREGLELAGNQPEYNEKLFFYTGDAFWYSGRFDSALVYHTKGQTSARETNNLPLLATLTINIADYYRQTGNFDKALDIYWEGIAYAKQDPSGTVLPKAYNNTALLFGYLGDTYTELNYYFKAIEAAEKPSNGRLLGLLYANVAEAYTTLGDYSNALKYASIGITKSRKANQLRYLMSTYEMMGVMYLNMDSLAQARTSFEESIRLNEQVKDKRFVARNLGNMGDLEKRLKNYPQAIRYYEQAITIQNEIAEKKFKIEDLLGLARTHIEQGNLGAAKKNNDEALKIAKQLGIRPFIAQSYLLHADILEEKGDTKSALSFRRQYDSIQTVLAKEDRLKYVNNLEKLNQAKLKELENLSLKKDMEGQAGVIDRQEKFFAAGMMMIFFLLAISFFILWLLRRNQSARKLITEQNAALISKNEEIQAMSDQQENLLHLVVHDLRSPLNKIEGLVNILRMEGGLTASQQELVKLMEDVSKKSKSFISEFLETSQVQYRSKQPKKEYFDLKQLLEEIRNEYTPHASKKEIEIVTEFNLPDQLAFSDKGLLYHIIINLLSNAIKYSPTNTRIEFRAWNEGDKLSLLIKDEGLGFDETDKQAIFKKFQRLSAKPIGPESSTGLGLYLTKILVDSLNGKISLESEEKKGSTFTIFFNNVFNQEKA